MSYVNSFPKITFAELYNSQEKFWDSIHVYRGNTFSAVTNRS